MPVGISPGPDRLRGQGDGVDPISDSNAVCMLWSHRSCAFFRSPCLIASSAPTRSVSVDPDVGCLVHKRFRCTDLPFSLIEALFPMYTSARLICALARRNGPQRSAQACAPPPRPEWHEWYLHVQKRDMRYHSWKSPAREHLLYPCGSRAPNGNAPPPLSILPGKTHVPQLGQAAGNGAFVCRAPPDTQATLRSAPWHPRKRLELQHAREVVPNPREPWPFPPGPAFPDKFEELESKPLSQCCSAPPPTPNSPICAVTRATSRASPRTRQTAAFPVQQAAESPRPIMRWVHASLRSFQFEAGLVRPHQRDGLLKQPHRKLVVEGFSGMLCCF